MKRRIILRGVIFHWLVYMSGDLWSLPALAESSASQAQILSRTEPTPPGSPQRSRGYITLQYGNAFFTDHTLAPGIAVEDNRHELLSANVGFNWGRYLGLEFAAFGYDVHVEAVGNKLGKIGFYSVMPQLRLRYPLLGDKLTPYLIAGAGPGRIEFHDQTIFDVSGAGLLFDVNDKATSLVYAVGGGLEYFIADNIALGLEAKYIGYNADFKVNGVATNVGVNNILLSAGLRLFFPGPPKTAIGEAPSATWWAFDPKELRPYLGLRVGIPFVLNNQITPTFVVSEHERSQVSSLSLGFNLNRYLGVELAVDRYGNDVEAIPQGKVSEYDVTYVIPQLRARYPLMNDKLVPYLVAGVGTSFTGNNDGTTLPNADPSLTFNVDDHWSVAGVIGAGVEYYVAYNMAVGIESKYVFTNPEVQIGGVNKQYDLNAVLVTAGLRLFYP